MNLKQFNDKFNREFSKKHKELADKNFFNHKEERERFMRRWEKLSKQEKEKFEIPDKATMEREIEKHFDFQRDRFREVLLNGVWNSETGENRGGLGLMLFEVLFNNSATKANKARIYELCLSNDNKLSRYMIEVFTGQKIKTQKQLKQWLESL